MESKDELKETDIKKCTRYYFDDILRLRNLYIINTYIYIYMYISIYIYIDIYICES